MTCYEGNLPKLVNREYARLKFLVHLGIPPEETIRKLKEEEKIREALVEERYYSYDFFDAHIRQQDSIHSNNGEHKFYDDEREFHCDIDKIREYFFKRALGLKSRLSRRLIFLSKDCDICKTYSEVACKSMDIYRKGVLLKL